MRELRDLFNALEIARKGRQGRLIRQVSWTGSRRPAHLPVGSRSRTWVYYIPNSDRVVAIAHVYLARGGQVIGEPDPKMLHIGQVIFTPTYTESPE